MKQVEAIQHKDVKGKTLYYIRIKNGTSEVLINVGEKTYKGVVELDNQQELPLQEPKNDNNDMASKNNKSKR